MIRVICGENHLHWFSAQNVKNEARPVLFPALNLHVVIFVDIFASILDSKANLTEEVKEQEGRRNALIIG